LSFSSEDSSLCTVQCPFEVMADHYSIHRLSLVGIVQILLEKDQGWGCDKGMYRRLELAGDSGNFISSGRAGVS